MKHHTNKHATTLAAFAAACLGTSAHAALVDGLVAYYDFEDLSNDPAASAVGLDLSESGTGGYTGVAGGRAGSGAVFTGTTGDLLLAGLGFGGGGLNQLGNSFSVSAWYNLDTNASSGASRFFIMEGSTDYDLSYGLRDNSANGGIAVPGFNDAQTYLNSGTDTHANHFDVHTPATWQHVVLTYDSDGTNTTVTTYIDTTASGAALVRPTNELTTAGIHIGNARNGSTNRAFDGMIDEFAAWDRVLNPLEVQQVFNLGSSGQALTVPEPSSTALLGLGGLALILRRRK